MPREVGLTSVVMGAGTRLVAQLDNSGDGPDMERVQDVLFRLGGTVDSVEAMGEGLRISAVFSSTCDATRAAVEVVTAAGGAPGTAPRVAVCSPEATPDGRADRWLPTRVAMVLDRAAPGQILVSAGTAIVARPTLPRGTVLLDRGYLPIDGGRRTQRVYELHRTVVVSQSNLDWARRAVDGSSIALDLTGLGALWDRVAAGEARFVLVSGPAGTGIGAVVGELALRLDAGGAHVLYGRWDPGATTPYHAFREALGVYADGCDTDQLRSDLEGHATGIATVLPEVAARISGRDLTELPAGGPAAATEALETWLVAIARRHPTLLVLDDAQWAGDAALRLLAACWHAGRRSPLMIAVTVSENRPDTALRRIRELGEHAGPGAFTHIRL